MSSEPAFPTPRYERGDIYSLGMSIRDYFAAKAMQESMVRGVHKDDFLTTARRAYLMADAMMKARGES